MSRTYVIAISVTLSDDELHDEYHEWKNERDSCIEAAKRLTLLNDNGMYNNEDYEELGIHILRITSGAR